MQWVDAGAPKGDPKDMPPPMKWPNEQGWNFAEHVRPDRAGPRSSSRRRTRRRPARRTRGGSRSSTTGLTEPRWVRAIEIRPGTVKGRKITHHAIARLQQDETDAARADRRRRRRQPGAGRSWSGRSASRARSCGPNTRQADAARLEDRAGTSTTRTAARTSPTSSSSASTSTRRARSRSSARRCALFSGITGGSRAPRHPAEHAST